MFSGPDFLYVDAFLPNRSTYVLSALEPVGQIPHHHGSVPPLAVHGLAGPARLARHGAELQLLHHQEDASNLSATTFRGTLPILYVFLARSGKTIQEVSLVSINADGAVVPAGQDEAQSARRRASRSCSRAAMGSRRRSTISAPTSPTTASRRAASSSSRASSARATASSRAPPTCRTADSFSKISEFLLDRSQALVQDNSGIPHTLLQAGRVAAAPVRPLSGPDRRVPGPVPEGAQRPVPQGQRAAARFRRGLSLAAQRIRTSCLPRRNGHDEPAEGSLRHRMPCHCQMP